MKWPAGWQVVQEGELLIASHYPLRDVRSSRPATRTPILSCTVATPEGDLDFATLHPQSPHQTLGKLLNWRTLLQPAQSGPLTQDITRDIEERRQDAEQAAAWIANDREPKIIVGDFNLPPESAIYRKYWTNYCDAFGGAGLGFGYTEWPRLSRQDVVRHAHRPYLEHRGLAAATLLGRTRRGLGSSSADRRVVSGKVGNLFHGQPHSDPRPRPVRDGHALNRRAGGRRGQLLRAVFRRLARVCAALSKDVWCSDEAMLGGRRLFGTANPVRMLLDTAPAAALKGPQVIMANGDVLPGKIVGFLPASHEGNALARLLIALDGSLVTADPRGLAVRADRVVRLASAVDETYAGGPGSLLLASGIRLHATAIRWTDRGLRALTSARPHDCPVRCYFGPLRSQGGCDAGCPGRQLLSSLGADRGDRKARDGLGSGADLFPRHDVDWAPARPCRSSRYLLVQPSWSSGTILVPDRFDLAAELCAAQEVPLSCCLRKRFARRSGSTAGPGGGTRTSRGARSPSGRSRWTWG